MPGATAPSPSGNSALIDRAVAQKFLDDIWYNRIDDNVFLQALKAEGQLDFGKKQGKWVEWNVRVGEHASEYSTRNGTRTWEPFQHLVPAACAYSKRELRATLREDDYEDLHDELALADYLQTELTRVAEQMNVDLNYEITAKHLDTSSRFGVAAVSRPADNPGVPGLLDIFDYGSTAYGLGTDFLPTTATLLGSHIEVVPDGSYCGVTTHPTSAISGITGRITGCTSPVLINASTTHSTILTTTTTSGWSNKADKLLDYAMIRCRRGNGAKRNQPTLCIMGPTDLLQLKNLLTSVINRDMMISEKPENSKNAALYTVEFLPYGSLKVCQDDATPTGVRYVLHPKEFYWRVKPRPSLYNRVKAIKGRTDSWMNVEEERDMDLKGIKFLATAKMAVYANPWRQGIIADQSLYA